MVVRFELDMVHRVSWLAGAMALALGLLRLGRLLRPAASGPPWQLILIGQLHRLALVLHRNRA